MLISRKEVLIILRKYLKTENTIKHLLASEAIMGALAKKLEPEKEDLWKMAGLLHDLDYEIAKPQDHCLKFTEILKKEEVDLPKKIIQAIKAHGYNLHPEFKPVSLMDWSLFCADSLTGLIVATTLVHPDKKIKNITVDSILKKFKDKAFARGTRREDIKLCEEKLNIPLKEFVSLGLEAMQRIAQDLGL